MRIISFIIPCYGSEKTISSVVEEIVSSMRPDDDYEIICVNDNSPDDVLSILKSLASQDRRIKVISFAMNFGQHNALMAGYRHATGDIVVSLDDDGQTPACKSYSLIDALDDQHDVIYARYPKKKHNWYRNVGSRVSAAMGRAMMSSPKDLYGSSFFACKRFIIDEIIRYENPYTFVAGLIFRSTGKIGNVDVEHRAREVGSSGYSFKKLISLWLNGFTSFSVKPLRVASIVGFALAVIGFVYGVFVVVNKLLSPGIAAGYSSTMAVILFVGGMLMLMMGLLGEYVGRVYISLNKAPQYVIRDTFNIEEGER